MYINIPISQSPIFIVIFESHPIFYNFIAKRLFYFSKDFKYFPS